MDPVQTNLLDLPIELLDKVCDYLTFFDVMTFGNINKHLKTVTARVLGTRTELDLTTYKFKHTDDHDGQLFVKAVERALKMYGHQIVKFKYFLLERPPAKTILPVIVKYCSGGKLVDLNLGNCSDESPKIIESLQPIYKHLKSLTLENYDLCYTNLEVILSKCPELEKLNLDLLKRQMNSFSSTYILDQVSVLDLANLLRNVKAPLKELSLNLSKRSWYRDIVVTNLLQILQHQQLRVFKLKGFDGEKLDTNIFNEYFPALEVLSLRYIDNQIKFQPLLKLCHLKYLDITVSQNRLNDFANFIEALAVQNRLKGLSLRYSHAGSASETSTFARVQKILDSLSSFTSLETLKIHKSVEEIVNAFEYAGRVPNLKHFTVSIDVIWFLYDLEGQKMELRRSIVSSIESFVTMATKLETLHIISNENFWIEDLFEKVVKIRRNNKSETMLHVYDYLDVKRFCNKNLQARYKRMKSNFVNVFPTMKENYP